MSFRIAKPRRRSSLSISTSSSSILPEDDRPRSSTSAVHQEDHRRSFRPRTQRSLDSSSEPNRQKEDKSLADEKRTSLSDLLSRSRADNDINTRHNSHTWDDSLRTGKSATSSSSGSPFTSGKMGSEQHSQDQVWGMPDFYDSVGPEVGLGVKTVSLTQVKRLMEHYHDTSVPTNVLFPWLHGIGDGPDGAYGPLENFFGNPPLDPPRYRGLCVVRAPYISGLAEEEGEAHPLVDKPPGPLVHSGAPVEQLVEDRDNRSSVGSISVGCARQTDPSPMNTARRDTMSSQISSPSTYYSTAPSDWEASSTFNQSYESGAYSPPTRTGSLASCPEDGSSGVTGWKMEEVAGGADHAATDVLAASFDSTRDEEAVPEGMHPTCVKAPSTRSGKRTSEGALQVTQEMDVVQEHDHGVDASTSMTSFHSRDLPYRRPSEPARPKLETSDSDRSKSTPEISRSISTPETPVSAHPADQVSMLRTISGRGNSRTGSPAPVLATNPPNPVMRTPDMGNLTIPEDDDSDVEVDLPQQDQPGSGLPTPGMNGDADARQHPELEQKSCMLVNALRAETLLDLHSEEGTGRFLPPDLGGQISLRNLMIQEIKYATISDLVIYAPQGLRKDANGNVPLLEIAKKFVQAQEATYRERLDLFHTEMMTGDEEKVPPDSDPRDDFPADKQGDDMIIEVDPQEGVEPTTYSDVLVQAKLRDQWQEAHRASMPIRYRVYIVTETFAEIERQMPQLVEATKEGLVRPERDLHMREAVESTKLAGASMIADGVWLGNGRDDPFRPDRVSPWLEVDLAIEAHDLADMPGENTIEAVYATIANRAKSRPHYSKNRSDASEVRETGPVYLEVGSSSRSSGCHGHSEGNLAERLVMLVECVSKIVKQKRRGTNDNMTVLLFCEDGYTETSLFALAYTMFTRNISLIDAYLTLHLELRRSFFVYPFDLQFLQTVEHRITEVLGKSKRAAIRPTSPIAKWNPFGISFPRSPSSNEVKEENRTTSSSRRPRKKSDSSNALVESWMTHPRFDGSLPSRIADHLYLGNLGHAVNSGMLKALGITHVVSVGETLAAEACFIHGHYVDSNDLSGNCKSRRKLDKEDQAIRIMDIQNVKDDGQDNLQPKFTAACAFMEEARKGGGKTLVHCRVGVSRSATIVIAYLMMYTGMSLMDAYLMTRARRLNVLIQPSLLFLREALHLESDLNRNAAQRMKLKSRWTWPALCRDIWMLNKRYLQPN